MNENRTSKLTVKNYVEKLSNEEDVSNFLKEHGICNAHSIDAIKPYTKNQDHKEMIITVKEEDRDNPIEIMFDIKAGEPSTDQVYNAIYDTGKHCEKRIIMYGGVNRNEIYPLWGRWTTLIIPFNYFADRSWQSEELILDPLLPPWFSY